MGALAQSGATGKQCHSGMKIQHGTQVRENWNKPPGTMTGLETVISVKVQRTGEVVSVKVVKSSGNDYFDQSAENAVYKASPLPFPDELRYYEFIKEFEFEFLPEG